MKLMEPLSATEKAQLAPGIATLIAQRPAQRDVHAALKGRNASQIEALLNAPDTVVKVEPMYEPDEPTASLLVTVPGQDGCVNILMPIEQFRTALNMAVAP